MAGRSPRLGVSLAMCAVLAAAVGLQSARASRSTLPDGFVYLRDIAPGIAQDMRYATPNNVIGRTLRGYQVGACILRRRAALALKSAHEALKQSGLGLMVFDCYRPARAVADLVTYTQEADDRRSIYHPALPAGQLIDEGYIAKRSGHSTGLAVDLTLVRLSNPAVPGNQPAPSCGGPRSATEADMGTGFDCFDPLAWAGAEVSPEQAANRGRLKDAMTAQGFAAYPREWWHFSLPPKNDMERQAFDFEIVRGPAQR